MSRWASALTTDPTAATGAATPGTNRRAVLVLGAVALVLVAGVIAAVAMVRPANQGGRAADVAADLPKVGQTVHTSFGFVTVSHIEHLKGLSQQDLSSANHGVANLVESGKEQVQVTVEITSDLGKETAPYSPEDFTVEALDAAGEKVIFAPVTTTVHAGRLQPFASVQGHLGFVVPADGKQLRLQFDDRGGSPIVIDLDHAGVDSADPAHHDDSKAGS